jgi:predicted transposase/invertase (TIGR01784 family)
MTTTLLDPTNDYVFKRLFARNPDLVVALINDIRPDLPPIVSVDILNPDISPDAFGGKRIVLDVLARDEKGHGYNVEIQVHRYEAWLYRGLFYLARTLSEQLVSGEDYRQLRASVGVHLLDFDLFMATEAQRQQALWRFEMRDEAQPHVTLGPVFQMNVMELGKADRLGQCEGALQNWLVFFKHWKEKQAMDTITHAPVLRAIEELKTLSRDKTDKYHALAREKAIRDEISLYNQAIREGLEKGEQIGLEKGEQIGLEKGEQIGLEKGEQIGLKKASQATARKLISLGSLPDATIAMVTGLSEAEVTALRASPPIAE